MWRNLACLAAFAILFPVACCIAEERELRFPEDRNCGNVLVGEQPTINVGLPNFNAPRNVVGRASGIVKVPAEAFLELDLNRAGSADLGFLSTLPADSVHALKLQGVTLGKAEFEYLARFTGLRSLVLSDCKVVEEVEGAQVPGSDSLQWLDVTMHDEPSLKQVAAWLNKCPKLLYLLDRNSPCNAATLRQFKGHPSLTYLTVNFDENAAEVIQALSELPRLHYLNVKITTDDYLAALPKLQGIRFVNGSNGSLGAAELKVWGELSGLTHLNLYETTIQADFSAGLSHLSALESLRINTSFMDCPPEEMQKGLALMKRLIVWPEIQQVTKQTLAVMASRPGIKEFELNSLATDATNADVAALCRVNTLESVTLKQIPFTAEIGEALSQCPKLHTLSLLVTTLDGNHLKHPERFQSLKFCSFQVLESAVNLSNLAQLPKLENLAVNLYSLWVVDFDFLADCPSLKTLSTHSSVVNDAAMLQISRSRTLETLWLGENCILSDLSLHYLTNCPQLSNLSMSGNFSVEGLEHLAQMPQLSSLTIYSILPEADCLSLKEHFAYLKTASFYRIGAPHGVPTVGGDGFWRADVRNSRARMDALEGMTLKELFGDTMTEAQLFDLQGNVVLVDFWGTWCGPCLSLMPDLERFHQAYNKDGFQVLGVHSHAGLEDLDDFLKEHPKPWRNLRDTDKKLQKAFAIPGYPSLFLFDRKGKLRVAMPYHPGMEAAIQTLLQEP